MKHPQYSVYLAERTRRYEKMSNITYNFLKNVPGLVVNRTNGAFYMSVAFKDGLLTNSQSLPIDKPEVRELVETLVSGATVSPDKRLCLLHAGRYRNLHCTALVIQHLAPRIQSYPA